MASKVPPVKNEALTFSTVLYARSDNQIKATPTLVTGDVKISKDNGAIANPGTLPVEDPVGSGIVKIVLTSDEKNADELVINFHDASGDEWHDQTIILHTVAIGQQFDDLSTFDDAIDTVDVGKISGGSAAADNVEATYDGTGYSDDAAPATQAQIGNLTSGTAAINTTVESFIKAGAEPETNTYEDTIQEDGTYHIVEDDAGATDCYYQFDVGGNGVPVSITWHGYAQSQGDSYTVWAYNYGTASYEQIGSINGLNGTTPITHTYDLTNAHVGTGVNLGKVRFRFLSADGTAFATDRVLCSYAIVSQSVGYADGAIWVNTNGSNINTENYVDGTADNPVSTWAAALIVASNMGLSRFRIISGSSIALTANSDNYAIIGAEYNLVLGGQSIAGSYIEGATVSGISAGINARFVDCKIGTVSLTTCGMKHCAIASDINLLSAGTYLFNGCFSGVAGTGTPSIDFGAIIGDTNLNMRHYSGGIEIKNMGKVGSDNMSLEGIGQLKINVSCLGGVVALRGHFFVTDNAAGAVTLSEKANFDKTVLIPEQTSDINTLETNDARLNNLDATIGSRATQASVDALPAASDINDTIWEDDNSLRTTPDTAGKVLKDAGAGVVSIADIISSGGVSIDPTDMQTLANLVLTSPISGVEDTADAISLAAGILMKFRAYVDPITNKLIIRKTDGLTLFSEEDLTYDAEALPITSVGIV